MSSNLVWLDLEMTGLEPESCVILEIATLVTDGELNILGEGPNLAIQTEEKVLKEMDDWNQNHHSASGLIDRVQSSDISCSQAEESTISFLKEFCEPRKSPLCGNSICQDRRFLYKYMPELSGFLHYRSIDVSSIKELAARWYPDLEPFPKKESHLALADIKESIEELRYYRKHVFKSL